VKNSILMGELWHNKSVEIKIIKLLFDKGYDSITLFDTSSENYNANDENDFAVTYIVKDAATQVDIGNVNELTESIIQSDIQIPEYYYRGAEMAMRSAYLTKIWRRPSPDLPDSLNGLLEQELTTHVYGLSYNLPFKISRTYSGMSNWGFGVYFASTVPWAMRYGENITCVKIDKESILAIRADDFAHETEGTAGGELRKRLNAKTGNSRMMSEEATVMAAVVRSMKKSAKALYVETSHGEGQICVFGKAAIYPKFYFEMQKSEPKNDI
jgi:hypothetical protein